MCKFLIIFINIITEKFSLLLCSGVQSKTLDVFYLARNFIFTFTNREESQRNLVTFHSYRIVSNASVLHFLKTNCNYSIFCDLFPLANFVIWFYRFSRIILSCDLFFSANFVIWLEKFSYFSYNFCIIIIHFALIFS